MLHVLCLFCVLDFGWILETRLVLLDMFLTLFFLNSGYASLDIVGYLRSCLPFGAFLLQKAPS